jgi:hypothetical protein
MKLHESFVRDALAGKHGEPGWEELRVFHDDQLRRMQHERLVHLVVTLFVATYFLLALGYSLARPSWPGFAIAGLLLVLLAAYLSHYFRLENGVQRWYHLANALADRAGHACARYEGGRVEPRLGRSL